MARNSIPCTLWVYASKKQVLCTSDYPSIKKAKRQAWQLIEEGSAVFAEIIVRGETRKVFKVRHKNNRRQES